MKQARRASHTILAVLTLFLVACGGGATPTATPGPTQSVRPATTRVATPLPRRGGGATIGVVGDLRQLNPAFGGATLAATLFRPVVEGLFTFDAQGKPGPWLAESVPGRGRGLSDDGLTAIVRLRQGVAWEDGKPFTAADVVFTLAAGKNPNNPFAPEIAAAYKTIRAADALDSYTVRLTLTAPGDDYLRAFAPVFPAHLFNGVTDLVDQPYARAPFGTGPFRFAAWTPGVSLTLARSDSYRLEDQPYLDTLTFRAYPDAAAAAAALRAGNVDLILGADGRTLTTPQGGAIYGVAPAPNAPPTWNAGEWNRR